MSVHILCMCLCACMEHKEVGCNHDCHQHDEKTHWCWCNDTVQWFATNFAIWDMKHALNKIQFFFRKETWLPKHTLDMKLQKNWKTMTKCLWCSCNWSGWIWQWWWAMVLLQLWMESFFYGTENSATVVWCPCLDQCWNCIGWHSKTGCAVWIKMLKCKFTTLMKTQNWKPQAGNRWLPHPVMRVPWQNESSNSCHGGFWFWIRNSVFCKKQQSILHDSVMWVCVAMEMCPQESQCINQQNLMFSQILVLALFFDSLFLSQDAHLLCAMLLQTTCFHCGPTLCNLLKQFADHPKNGPGVHWWWHCVSLESQNHTLLVSFIVLLSGANHIITHWSHIHCFQTNTVLSALHDLPSQHSKWNLSPSASIFLWEWAMQP